MKIYVGLVSASARDRSSWRPSHIEEAERRGRSGAGHVEAFSCEGGVKVGSEGPTDCLWSRRDQKCVHMSNGRLRRSVRRHLHLRGVQHRPADSATQRGNSWKIPAFLGSFGLQHRCGSTGSWTPAPFCISSLPELIPISSLDHPGVPVAWPVHSIVQAVGLSLRLLAANKGPVDPGGIKWE